jgi:uncharacterized SAM-binding protein YcdF (DUF218 family)
MTMADGMGLGRRRRPARRRLGAWRWPIRALAVVAVLWLVGFAWFLGVIAAERPATPMPHAGGIVVLTGGADRVKAGLELLLAGAAPRLLISGAGAGTYLGDFTARDGIDANARATDITVGHAAATTRGNARETAAWAHRHHMGSLIVVTADYHMPRALLELRRAMPGVTLVPEPVRPPAMLDPARPHMLRILVTEFFKYIVVRLRLGGIAAHRIRAHG